MPADVYRKLLRLRSRKEHAEVQRLQEMIFFNPFLFFDHVPVHNRYLACGTAEADEAEL